MPLVGSKRVAGGQTQSSSGSGVFFPGDVYQQGQINSNLSSSFGNSANSVSGKGCSNLYLANGDMSRTGLNSASNSGPSVGASSMVTDANSALSGGPQLQRSASFNAESYMRMPASPMSFSSNNISLSGNSLLDGSSIVQQSSHQDQNSQQGQTRHGASTASSRIGQGLGPTGKQVPYSSNQEAQYISQMQKKPRLDIKDDILQQQARLQRQNSLYLQGYNPQMQTLIQQQRHLPRQQLPQQMLQSVPQMQRAQMQQQMQNDQLRQQYQQSLQPLSGLKRQYENGACGRRIMQYLYHQRQRPEDNSFAYWKKFTEAYFAPCAKKRWCLSLYDNVGQHALGVFPQATMDAWHCEICGSKSGRGFEASYEVLPRLFKVKFDSGVKDELLYLDLPREGQLSSGLFILEYGKAVQESVYEHLRVTREGRLRVMFSPELKILSWEFCARRHEELLPRRFVAPQVNQLLQVAQKYQNAVTESGSDGVSTQDLQANWNMFLTAGRQLARSMELPLLNDLGFSKRYVRCLQISEVVNSMEDLMDFSKQNKIGPIESLKNYPQQGKFSMQNMQVGQQGGGGGLSGDRNPLNNMMSVNPSLGGQISINNHMVGRGGYPNTPTQTTLSGYQNFLRQNSISSNPNAPQQEGSFVNNPSFCGTVSSTQSTMQNGPVNGMTNPHFHQQKQQEPQAVNGDLEPQPNNPESSAGNQSAQSDMIQQLFHEMMGNNGEVSEQQQQQQSLGGQNANGSIGEETSIPPNAVTDGGLPAKTSATDGGSTVGPGDNGVNNVSGDAAAKEAPEGSSNDKTSASISADDNCGLDFSDVLNFPEIDCDLSNTFPEWDL